MKNEFRKWIKIAWQIEYRQSTSWVTTDPLISLWSLLELVCIWTVLTNLTSFDLQTASLRLICLTMNRSDSKNRLKLNWICPMSGFKPLRFDDVHPPELCSGLSSKIWLHNLCRAKLDFNWSSSTRSLAMYYFTSMCFVRFCMARFLCKLIQLWLSFSMIVVPSLTATISLKTYYWWTFSWTLLLSLGTQLHWKIWLQLTASWCSIWLLTLSAASSLPSLIHISSSIFISGFKILHHRRFCQSTAPAIWFLSNFEERFSSR